MIRILGRHLSGSSRAMSRTAVIGEFTADGLHSSTLAALTAARALGQPADLVLAGKGAAAAASAAAVTGVGGFEKIFFSENEKMLRGIPDVLAPAVARLARAQGATHVLGGNTAVAKGLLPAVAAHLGVSALSDILAVRDARTFERAVYAGNAVCTLRSDEAVVVATVRASAFDKMGARDGAAPAAEEFGGDAAEEVRTRFVGSEIAASERPDLATAERVVSGGRGFKTKENFALLYELADKLGAGVGASRAAVDGGLCPNDMQVGQTGSIVAPELYIAVGISGQIQHLAGMKDSKVIAAINTDRDAPIFQVADYGLVADLFDAVPEMIKKLD